MSHAYYGSWHIIDMDEWDQDYIDLVVPGYISFDEKGSGVSNSGRWKGR